jgi:hypothetical protein
MKRKRKHSKKHKSDEGGPSRPFNFNIDIDIIDIIIGIIIIYTYIYFFILNFTATISLPIQSLALFVKNKRQDFLFFSFLIKIYPLQGSCYVK